MNASSSPLWRSVAAKFQKLLTTEVCSWQMGAPTKLQEGVVCLLRTFKGMWNLLSVGQKVEIFSPIWICCRLWLMPSSDPWNCRGKSVLLPRIEVETFGWSKWRNVTNTVVTYFEEVLVSHCTCKFITYTVSVIMHSLGVKANTSQICVFKCSL